MDISALLSPQESHVRDAAPSAEKASPKKPRKPRASSTPKVGASPLSRIYTPSDSSASNGGTVSGGTSQPRLPVPSPPANGSLHLLIMSATGTPPADGMRLQRQSSTSGMDTLADLASMQHHQQAARANAGGLRSTEVYDTQLSPATSLPTFHTLSRHHSGSRVSSIDMAMQDAPAQPSPPPRTYSAASLSESELQTVAQLVSYLTENPYAYESHVQLVNILHKGLIDHVYPPDDPSSRRDPQSYNLLGDLRQAVEAMDARFTLGEGLWLDRLQVLKLLANTLEECIGVMEAYKKAVTEEAGSSKLWVSYGDWMLSLHNMANPRAQYPLQLEEDMGKMVMWAEEDKIVTAEVFNKTQILEIWRQGSEETQYRINDSHLIWDRYTELLLQDLSQSPSREGVISLKKHFSDRLEIPHAKWEDTFQTFSTFISTYDNASWEQTMVSVKRQSARAKKAFEARETFENKLQIAIDSEDKAAEWSIMTEYLEWERTEGKRQKIFSFNLSNALYQRALLRFASDTDLWEDYLMFLIDEGEHGRHNFTSLPVLQRACRHCPWSGTLWSQYLQEAERENQPFVDIGEIKHKATSTGLLDAGGMEEVLKVHTAWCGYLRRQAFQRYSTDEEMDVAEVGIRSAIEDMETLGRQKYGKEYQGDPEYRLERIYIKYLSQSLNWQGARDTWKGLIARHGNSYEFWLRYYNWEMITWSKLSHVNSALPDEVPHEATKVLREAVKRTNMDWPEKIMEVLMRHCEDHENVAELQHALNQTRKAKKAVAKRRETEALEAAELAKQQQQQHAEAGADSEAALNSAKRKRDTTEGPDDETSVKKSRPSIIESKEHVMEEPSNSAPALLKRDRENSTIIVKNLPTHTTETTVRQYFRDCGTINSLKLIPEDDGASAAATIEFESKEDVLTAQTKDMKMFDGNPIEIQVGTGSTLYITNFPATADDAYLRNLFGKYGDIISIRFPSLKYNKRRRFCYVQFKSSSQAQAATELDGTPQEGNLKLSVLISDPGHKKARTGAVYEGREIHVSNVDWSATEDELSEVFSKYGTVERVRIPRDLGGKSKGFAFIVFSDKDSATASLDLHNTKFKSRLLHVSISTADPAKRQAINTTARASTSTSPAPPDHSASTTSTSPHPPNPFLNTNPTPRDPALAASIAARTLALLHIPDTVSEARLRALLAPYGALKKISMRLDHGGAVVEFEDEASVGKASLGLEGVELDGGTVGVGSVKDLMREKGVVRRDRIEVGGGKSKEKLDGGEGVGRLLTSGVVRRPGVGGGARRGGRGGLGLKGSGGGLGGLRAGAGQAFVKEGEGRANGDGEDAGHEGEAGEGGKGAVEVDTETEKPKRNADFKAMFLKEKH
ncbi:Splicing factor [Trapelia coarctata]|nr:Splicing factor [Trapelia coarctata]